MPMKKFQLAIFLISLFVVTSIAYQNIPNLRQKIAGMKTEGERELIVGLIIPHHLLAKELINDTINKIEDKESYEMILLIGPNHFHPESNTFTTTDSLD